MTQYVAVKFKPWDRRTYTYHNDGAPAKPGDMVEVETKEGLKKVQVDSVSDQKPAFATKPIKGIIDGGVSA